MSVPRNRKALEQSQALRATIAALLGQHPPLARPLSGKDVLARLTLSPRPALRTVQLHLQKIRDGAGDSLRSAQFIP